MARDRRTPQKRQPIKMESPTKWLRYFTSGKHDANFRGFGQNTRSNAARVSQQQGISSFLLSKYKRKSARSHRGIVKN